MHLHRSGRCWFATVAAVAATLLLSPVALAGDPLTDIKVNEVESEGIADFIELVNIGSTPTDVSGLVLKDNDDARTLTIPGGTSVPAGAFLAVDTDAPGGFGLGSSDAARVFLPDGITQIDGFTWTAHAATTFGRCPDGTGAFATTGAVTKGAANACLSAPATETWPGSASVTTADQAGVLGADVSGLEIEGSGSTTPGVLWAVDNGNSRLDRLVWDGTQWVRDTAGGWSAGKALRYPGGGGLPDAEGVTLTGDGAAGGVYVSSERDGANSGVSRPSVLRYDVSGAGTTLSATHEWNLTADLPAVAANAGVESVEWVPDSYLVGSGFADQATGARYDPATYPTHGTGLFFVGLEANGLVYAYALDQTFGAFTRVATFASGFTTFGALHFDPDAGQLWVVCDNNCDGRSRVFEVDRQAGATKGHFVAVADYARPAGMANLNNEGFTIAPGSECAGGSRPVHWADDGNTGGHVLRAGTVDCSPLAPPLARAGWSATTSVKGDFDGDGFGDLAVGVREGLDRGAVHVLPGSATGVTAASSQLWSQNSLGIADTAEDGDDFGRALAVGDFNFDGFADLAIGTPGENDGAGAVHVLYGSASGLNATGSQMWSQASGGVGDNPEPGDHFGATVAGGDLDGSSVASELAIGVPDEEVGTVADAGVVQVLRGVGRLTGSGSQTWSQASAGVAGNPSPGERFGSALAIGDLGGSPDPDLAIGVPEEDGSAGADQGSVHVLPGSVSGATATGSSQWSQDSPGVGDTGEAGDGFGASLAIGNVGGTSAGDLVVGVPGEDSGAAANAGLVQTLFGAAAGPTGSGSQRFGQATVGIADTPETGDELGFSVAVGDFGGDDAFDLAVGAPGESGTTTPHSGVVHLIPGSASGLTATGSQLWSQNSSGVPDVAEASDRFGAALAAADYGNSTDWDLAVGVPAESTGLMGSTGLVEVLPGTATFLTGAGSKAFGQNTAGVADAAEPLDAFGIALGR